MQAYQRREREAAGDGADRLTERPEVADDPSAVPGSNPA
jgi:hypothetical protein